MMIGYNIRTQTKFVRTRYLVISCPDELRPLSIAANFKLFQLGPRCRNKQSDMWILLQSKKQVISFYIYNTPFAHFGNDACAQAVFAQKPEMRGMSIGHLLSRVFTFLRPLTFVNISSDSNGEK